MFLERIHVCKRIACVLVATKIQTIALILQTKLKYQLFLQFARN